MSVATYYKIYILVLGTKDNSVMEMAVRKTDRTQTVKT